VFCVCVVFVWMLWVCCMYVCVVCMCFACGVYVGTLRVYFVPVVCSLMPALCAYVVQMLRICRVSAVRM